MSIGRVLLFVILLAACGGIAFLAFNAGSEYLAEQPVEDAANAYMEAIRIGDYTAAYALTDPIFQSQMGGPDGLQNLLASWGFFPESWNFHYLSVENGIGSLRGSVDLTNARIMGVELDLVQVEGDWRISRMEFIDS